MKIRDDYSLAKFGTYQYILFQFLSMHFIGEVKNNEEIVRKYMKEHPQNVDKLHYAIEDLLATQKYSERSKAKFISQITNYSCSRIGAIAWLNAIGCCLKRLKCEKK